MLEAQAACDMEIEPDLWSGGWQSYWAVYAEGRRPHWPDPATDPSTTESGAGITLNTVSVIRRGLRGRTCIA
jgi:hypothetical protein